MNTMLATTLEPTLLANEDGCEQCGDHFTGGADLCHECAEHEFDQLASLYSDAHKAAYGFRPRGMTHGWTIADYERELDACQVEIDREHWEKGVRMFEAAATYHREVNALVELGAGDRAQAVRWWYEANGFKEPEEQYRSFRGQEAESVLYGRGFPSSMWKHILPEFMGEPTPEWGY
jgi:hypothetical protein